jgi:hypothetical protein
MRRRPASVLIRIPTTSMVAKVSRYCVSLTVNLSRGGTKKKSNVSTLRTAVSIDGPRPTRTATKATPRR